MFSCILSFVKCGNIRPFINSNPFSSYRFDPRATSFRSNGPYHFINKDIDSLTPIIETLLKNFFPTKKDRDKLIKRIKYSAGNKKDRFLMVRYPNFDPSRKGALNGFCVFYDLKNLIYHYFKDDQGFYHLKFVIYYATFCDKVGCRLHLHDSEEFNKKHKSLMELSFKTGPQLLEIYQFLTSKMGDSRKNIIPFISNNTPFIDHDTFKRTKTYLMFPIITKHKYLRAWQHYLNPMAFYKLNRMDQATISKLLKSGKY